MPDKNGRGFSNTTFKKQIVFENILQQNISIVKRIGEKHKKPICYLYIDACSATGMNPEITGCRGVPCKGSPTIFLDVAENLKIDYRAHFIEWNNENYKELNKNLRERKSNNKNKTRKEIIKTTFTFYNPFNFIFPIQNQETTNLKENHITTQGEYRTYLSDYHDKIFEILNFNPPKNQYTQRCWNSGLIYFDPNSFPDFQFVESLSQHTRCKYLDLLFHFSATSLKRTNRAFPKKYTTLKEYIEPINKDFWFIRELGETAHQMTFLLGTNMPNYEVKAPGWYNMDSRIGQDIINKKSLTKEEYDLTKIQKQLKDNWC